MRGLIIAVSLMAVALAAADVSTQALEMLRQADALLEKGDRLGALKAYLRAVEIDPAAEDLHRLRSYYPRYFLGEVPKQEKATGRDADRLLTSALRDYVRRHPLEWKAVSALMGLVELPEAERLLETNRAALGEVEFHRTRAAIRRKHRSWAAAVADHEKVIELAPEDPENRFALGVDLYERAATDAAATTPEKKEAIARGLSALDAAIRLRPDYLEAHVYRWRFLEERAKLEEDPARRTIVQEQSDAARRRAIEIRDRRRAALEAKAAEPPPSPPADEPPLRDPQKTWNVFLVQEGEELWALDGEEVPLKRAPFTIRVVMLDPAPVMLNALASDAVIKRVRPGFRFVEDCRPIVAFCGGTAMAEEPLNPNRRLILAEGAVHYLYYESPDDHRWSRVDVQGETTAFDRDVAVLGDAPIEKTSMPALYLAFMVVQDDDGAVSDYELRRVIIRFRQEAE